VQGALNVQGAYRVQGAFRAQDVLIVQGAFRLQDVLINSARFVQRAGYFHSEWLLSKNIILTLGCIQVDIINIILTPRKRLRPYVFI